MTLAGKSIAVTGGTGGIGSATVRRLAARGANILVLDLDAAAVTGLTSELTEQGHHVRGAAVDTTDEAAMSKALDDAAEAFGALDGMVSAAGVDHPQIRALDVELDLWERVQRVNVTGAFIACRTAARLMLGRGGAIVTVGSASAVTARMGKVPYCASKAGMVHMTRTLAVELAEHGVRVNAVCPGPTDTPMVAAAVEHGGPEILERRIRGSLEDFRVGVPLGRIGTADEQAAVIEFLLSPDASFMTGAVLFVDGGVTVL